MAEGHSDGQAPGVEPDELTANPGYALDQLAKALQTREEEGDPATRERARGRVARWMQVLSGMLSGSLAVGSRQPIPDKPVWATPEVVKGGFTTGRLLAGGPLLDHEQLRLESLGLPGSGRARQSLNASWLTPEGIVELGGLLESGRYRIRVPEEAVLLVVCWLLKQGRLAEAKGVLAEIEPLWAELRFYPEPHDRPCELSEEVALHSVDWLRDLLRKVRIPQQMAKQRESIQVWLPLYDRILDLFIETIEGEVPTLVDDRVTGGWPCARFSPDWLLRAQRLLEERASSLERHHGCRRPRRTRGNDHVLHRCLEICRRNPAELTGRDVGLLRRVIASINSTRGLPGSGRWRELRESQARLARIPTFDRFTPILVRRLAPFDAEDGLRRDEIDAVCMPVGGDEAGDDVDLRGLRIPGPLRTKVSRCLRAPVQDLVEHGLVGSSESLAALLPHMTALSHARAHRDPALARLFAQTYLAFRRRRSLLLFNLQSQVALAELPWVRPVLNDRSPDSDDRALARQTLFELVHLALASFPQSILPNKLLQDISALAKQAELAIPITDELAADIFMGAFAGKFVAAARIASQLLDGRLYGRYYGIPWDRIRSLPKPGASHFNVATSPGFLRLCEELSGTVHEQSRSPAINGRIIEQQQIITTHNLAPLLSRLEMREVIEAEGLAWARSCAEWICRRQQIRITEWKARLRMLKNAAHAWRQMIFFLSFQPDADQRAFVDWLREMVVEQKPELAQRFLPAVDGLEMAIEGSTPPIHAAGMSPRQPRRFLGWVSGPHWLMPVDPHRPS